MSDEREASIRRRAYELWEQGGGDHGRDQDHWHQASGEIDAASTDATEPPANTVAPDGTTIGNGSDTADQPAADDAKGASIVDAEVTTPAAPASPAATKPAPRPRKPKTK
jgi:hypothetical protein